MACKMMQEMSQVRVDATRGGTVLCHVRARRAGRGLGLRGHAGRHVSKGGHGQRKLLQWFYRFQKDLFMFLFFNCVNVIKQVVNFTGI